MGLTPKQSRREKGRADTRRYRERNSARLKAERPALNAARRQHYAERGRIVYQREIWARTIEKKYGLSVEDIARMAHAQGFGCAICRRPLRFDQATNIDHCHTTGVVRGLLCNHCNRGLGAAFDSPDRLMEMARYLRRTAP